MRVPFVGPSYQARSLNADCQRSLNCFVEMDNNTPRAPMALYGTPGTTYLGTVGSGPWRAALREKSVVYVVSGNEVYKLIYTVGVGYSATILGVVGTSSGPIGIASNGSQIIIVDGTAGWIINTTTYIMTVIAAAAFPNGVTRVTYQDQFFIVSGDGTGKFYINHTPGDGTTWNGLDFATAEGAPDNTIGIISDHRELWIFGDKSIEVWANTGAAAFPFERNGNAFIQHGCQAADSICRLDNTIFWLGTDDEGGATVWRIQGYTPTRISTHAIEKAMQSYTTVADARAFAYQQEGHLFYVLSFPTADKTWVYDVATGQWHERAWMDFVLGMHMWRPICHVFWNFDHIVGDFQNGRFYKLQLDSNLDDGMSILRLRTTTATESEQKRLFYSSLQVDMETGNGGNLSLRYSNDGGHTWSSTKTASMGATADARCTFKNLGSGRNRVWEISTTDNVKWAVFGAVANVTEGDA